MYWIEIEGPGRLAIMPKPWGFDRLEGEIRSLARAGVQILVSMLPPEEATFHGLDDEGFLAQRHGLRFLSHPVPDHTVPAAPEATWTLARSLAGDFQKGQAIAVHCYAGIGRSALLLACVLCSLGRDAESAWAAISQARGFEVPETEEQRKWITLNSPQP